MDKLKIVLRAIDKNSRFTEELPYLMVENLEYGVSVTFVNPKAKGASEQVLLCYPGLELWGINQFYT